MTPRHRIPALLQAIGDHIDPAAFDTLPEADATALRLLGANDFEDSAVVAAVRKHIEQTAHDDAKEALRVLTEANPNLAVPLLLSCSEFALQLGASLT